MPSYRLTLLLITICGLLAAGGWQESRSFSRKSTPVFLDIPASTLLPKGVAGSALVDKLLSVAAGLGDYQFDATLDTLKGGKVVRTTATFYVKPPTGLRVEVKDYGEKSGSVLIRRLDGSIRAKGGPAMWGIKLNLSPNSRLLVLPNGVSVLASDLASLLGRLKKQSAAGYAMVASPAPLHVQSLNRDVLLLESQLPRAGGGLLTDRVFIDPANYLVLQWDLFDEQGNFMSRSRFDNYQTKAHFDDSQFDI